MASIPTGTCYSDRGCVTSKDTGGAVEKSVCFNNTNKGHSWKADHRDAQCENQVIGTCHTELDCSFNSITASSMTELNRVMCFDQYAGKSWKPIYSTTCENIKGTCYDTIGCTGNAVLASNATFTAGSFDSGFTCFNLQGKSFQPTGATTCTNVNGTCYLSPGCTGSTTTAATAYGSTTKCSTAGGKSYMSSAAGSTCTELQLDSEVQLLEEDLELDADLAAADADDEFALLDAQAELEGAIEPEAI
eukprot:tig00000391_g24834.t1